MPVILFINGWRFFFYSNENKEPIHVHVQKAEMEAKFWMDEKDFEIRESFSHRMSPPAKREVKKIIYLNFDYIVDQWKKLQKMNLAKSKLRLR